jgi:hypothetical protein
MGAVSDKGMQTGSEICFFYGNQKKQKTKTNAKKQMIISLRDGPSFSRAALMCAVHANNLAVESRRGERSLRA